VRREFAGRYIRLKPLSAEEDFADLFQASHRTPAHLALWEFLAYGPFADAQAMRDWLCTLEPSVDPIFFTVTHLRDGAKVGMISILSIVPEMGRAELGHIWYGPEVQRTKVNTEAVFLLLNYLFVELHYRRVEWKCDARNERSKSAALRLGFASEGTFRQHMVVKGLNRDTAWFAMLDHEWPRTKANFIHWLYEDDGISLRRLNSRT